MESLSPEDKNGERISNDDDKCFEWKDNDEYNVSRV